MSRLFFQKQTGFASRNWTSDLLLRRVVHGVNRHGKTPEFHALNRAQLLLSIACAVSAWPCKTDSDCNHDGCVSSVLAILFESFTFKLTVATLNFASYLQRVSCCNISVFICYLQISKELLPLRCTASHDL